ncbi:MAG: helicase, partial [Halobacteriales archaeon]|nr:helicase [Halobacteriales archaeon]
MTDDDAGPEDETLELDAFYDVLEEYGRPLVTTEAVARARGLTQPSAYAALDALAASGRVDRLRSGVDPVVWFPTDWKETTDRERVTLFPNRREIVVDQPTQFTRARLASFAHLVETNRSGGYVYEIRPEDIWQAPYDTLEAAMATIRGVVGERSAALADWVESQWDRAHAFRLSTHEDGYVVLEARSADLLGNIAEQHLDAGQIRARIGDTEAWIAESETAAVKRTLYEAGYPVRDERTLE